MATKKGQSSTRNGRTSNPKYLGLKCSAGQLVKAGSILVKQRGTKIKFGNNVGCGRDYTLYALCIGKVVYKRKQNSGVVVSVEKI